MTPSDRKAPDEAVGSRRGAHLIGSFIDACSWAEALDRIDAWCGQSRVICICNVHSIVTATHDKAHQAVLNAADMSTPDGMPLAWSLRKMGFPAQQRINGPDLMWKYCARAANGSHKVYLYGSTESTLVKLSAALKAAFPLLQIAGISSPPFRQLTVEEDEADIERINASGADVIFVSLGCPKQERWMYEHRGRIKCVMIGVGAAFDYHAGTIRRAPLWMQNSGLEWLHRLASEPRRLWRRYLITNFLFVWKMVFQLAARRREA